MPTLDNNILRKITVETRYIASLQDIYKEKLNIIKFFKIERCIDSPRSFMSSSKTQLSESVAVNNQPEASGWKIKLLYDGECPLCLREVNFLQKRDAGRGLVAFVDIAANDYTPEANGGVDYETAMGRIHAVFPDGTVIKNVEVFRRVYEILGMGWIYAVTKLPIVGAIANKLYEIWADWRLKLTGRPDLATIVGQRQQRIECETQGRCRIEKN